MGVADPTHGSLGHSALRVSTMVRAQERQAVSQFVGGSQAACQQDRGGGVRKGPGKYPAAILAQAVWREGAGKEPPPRSICASAIFFLSLSLPSTASALLCMTDSRCFSP